MRYAFPENRAILPTVPLITNSAEPMLNEGLTMVMRTFYITKDLSGDEGQEPGLSL